MNRDGNGSQAITPAALGRFVLGTRRGRRAGAIVVVGAVALGLVIGLLNSLADLPRWVGVLCLIPFVSVTVPDLFRMVKDGNQSPSD